MKILHLASFKGNLGDNINHIGLRKMISEFLKDEVEWISLEIRDYYFIRNKKSFDDKSFIELCNSSDLIIIGGGGFFDAIWINSKTSTTINISETTLSKIKKPIVIYGMGFNTDYNELNLKKFELFLKIILIDDNIFVSIRDDGSYERLSYIYHKNLINKLHIVSDGSYFFPFKKTNSDKKYIGIQLAKDDLEVRFQGKNSQQDYHYLLTSLVYLIEEQVKNGFKVVFFPHIYSDVEAIYDILKLLSDDIVRENVIIERYHSSSNLLRDTLDLYQQCRIIIAMRYHSNVISLGSGVPTIGIASLPKVSMLYAKLGLINFLLDPTGKDFKKRISELVNLILTEQIAFPTIQLESFIKMDGLIKLQNFIFSKLNKSIN